MKQLQMVSAGTPDSIIKLLIYFMKQSPDTGSCGDEEKEYFEKDYRGYLPTS